jgi:NAD+-dependent protein deacetylase sirtuin 6
MSASYASRLKDYPNKGVCGLPEMTETARAYKIKVKELAVLMRESNHTVVLTGAGISTAAGIPDFRGPKGIWTLENKKQQKHKRKRKLENAYKSAESDDSACSMDFAAATPTFTHRTITRLVSEGIVHFAITQNVDGLHRRSGLSRDKHAVLHGCAFTETCQDCKTEHFRDTDVGGMSFQKTGRKCEVCSEDLRDTLLDWEDPLPEDDLERSERECEKADLAICLGTSLRINPANQLPLKAKKFVIVNLQKTPMDNEAALIIRERVDAVMKDVLEHLGCNQLVDEAEPARIERLWKLTKTGNKKAGQGRSES